MRWGGRNASSDKWGSVGNGGSKDSCSSEFIQMFSFKFAGRLCQWVELPHSKVVSIPPYTHPCQCCVLPFFLILPSLRCLTMLNFTWGLWSWKTVMVKEILIHLCSGKWLIAKHHLSSHDIDKTQGIPFLSHTHLPMTRPDRQGQIPILSLIND